MDSSELMDSRFERIIRQNQLKTYAVLCVYIAIFVFIGLLADIIRLNSQSLQEGFYLLLTLQEFPLITFIMGIVAFGVIMYSVGQFSRIMLSGNEYKRINPNLVLSRRESTLYGVFSDLLKSANCPFEPALYIIEAPYMNAFASGWNEKNSMIAITSTLLERLKEDELKAVIAHELSHIRHGDVRLTMCVGILSNIMLLGVNIFAFYFSSSNSQGARVIAHELSHIRHGDVRLTMCVGILSNIMLLGVNIFAFYFSSSNSQGARVARNMLSHIRHGDVRLTMCVGILSNIMLLGVNIFAFYFSSSNSQGARVARNILLVLQFILPLLTMVLSLFISRNREYMADSGAAYLMRDSEPMIRALQKISQDYAQNTYTEPNPTRASAYLFDTSEILSTHPSIQNRIKSLLGQRF